MVVTNSRYYLIGESGSVIFEFDLGLLNDVIDWFGKDVDIKDKRKGTYEARVYVNLRAMRFWALQYSEYAKVLSTKRLVDAIKNQLNETIKKYK